MLNVNKIKILNKEFDVGDMVEVVCNNGRHIIGYITKDTNSTAVYLASYKKETFIWLTIPVKTTNIKSIEELMPVPDELKEYESGKLGMAYGD